MKAIKSLSKKLPFLKDIDVLKKELDKHRPLSKEIEDKVFQKLRLDWNYNSNAIEGNTFTFGETIALIMEGITAKGKPLKDALDIKGHNDAINFMLDMIHGERDLNETDIRNLHELILGTNYYTDAITSDGKPTKKLINVGKYKTEPNHVKTSTGEIHHYATVEETPSKMKELMQWYTDTIKSKEFHPLVLASIFHHKFVAIHPFDDGNGRMARILTNFILLKFGYPISVIKQEKKGAYYACLAQADRGELIPVIEYLSNTVKHSLQIYFKAINGENINEPDDLDKEIALFRKEIGVKPIIRKKKKGSPIHKICFEYFSALKKKMDKFSDFFLSYSEFIHSSSFKFDLHKEILLDYQSFMKMVNNNSPNLNYINKIIYQYKFNNDIDLRNTYINVDLSIEFKEKLYIITYKNERIIKYYDDKTLDENFNNLLKIIVKDVMSQIREIKN